MRVPSLPVCRLSGFLSKSSAPGFCASAADPDFCASAAALSALFFVVFAGILCGYFNIAACGMSTRLRARRVLRQKAGFSSKCAVFCLTYV